MGVWPRDGANCRFVGDGKRLQLARDSSVYEDYSAGKPTAWMPPVYPFIMAAAFKIFGVFSNQAAIALEIFQIIVSALTCIVLYFLGKRLYNAKAGLVAAFLFAMYPPAIHFAVQKIWSTSLFTCCFLLVILVFLWRADHPHVKGGIFSELCSDFQL